MSERTLPVEIVDDNDKLADLVERWNARSQQIELLRLITAELAEPLEAAADKHWCLPARCASLFDVLADGRLRFYCGRHGGLRTVRVEELER